MGGGGISGGIELILSSQYFGTTVMAIASNSGPIHPAARLNDPIGRHNIDQRTLPHQAKNSVRHGFQVIAPTSDRASAMGRRSLSARARETRGARNCCLSSVDNGREPRASL